MNIAEQLSVLQAAEGHPAKLALAVVDLAYSSASASERDALREALQAAAIPHWCDAAILSALSGTSVHGNEWLLTRLSNLSIVEPFPARGNNVVNVHEASRLAIRKWLATEQSEKFRELSARAATFFAEDSTASGRIEWMYHLLSADPEGGGDALETLDREWTNQVGPEVRYAFAATLRELEKGKFLSGRARLWALLSIAWTDATRGDHAVLAQAAAEALELARALHDKRAEGDAQWLMGDVLMAQGKGREAEKAYEANLKISRTLAEEHPDHAGWQREYAAALFMVSRMLDARGRSQEAEKNRLEAVALIRRITEREPEHRVWRHDLSRALIELGDMFQSAGQFTEAKAAFDEALEIRKKSTEEDPTNAFRQQELALGHSRLGDFWLAQENLIDAHEAYKDSLAITEKLVERDATHDDWQKALSVSLNRMGNLLLRQNNFEEAQKHLEKALEINRNLAAKNPGNMEWQRELSAALNQLACVHHEQNNSAQSLQLFEEALQVSRSLARRDPERVEWQRELSSACIHVARSLDDRDRALSLYDESLRILQNLIDSGAAPASTEERDFIANERAQLEGVKPNGATP